MSRLKLQLWRYIESSSNIGGKFVSFHFLLTSVLDYGVVHDEFISGQPEITDLGISSLVDENVLRFQVTMDDAVLM
jgi:hypothetical protein